MDARDSPKISVLVRFQVGTLKTTRPASVPDARQTSILQDGVQFLGGPLGKSSPFESSLECAGRTQLCEGCRPGSIPGKGISSLRDMRKSSDERPLVFHSKARGRFRAWGFGCKSSQVRAGHLCPGRLSWNEGFALPKELLFLSQIPRILSRFGVGILLATSRGFL
jgi:hypothetical protein